MRAGVYCRISSDRSGDRAGVRRQEEDCRRYCAERGWQVTAVYIDNDRSAYSGKRRPEYERMLADLAAGRLDAVVSWHNDRLHRSPKELEHFIDVVNSAHADVGIVTGGKYDLTTASGRMTARIIGDVARGESEHKSERIRRKHLQLAQEGKVSGGPRPFGYQRKDKRLVIDKREAKLVKEAADRVLRGQTTRAIVRDWNKRGLLTSYGKPWNVNGLTRILVSGRIAGLREHGPGGAARQVVGKAAWEPIIDEETHGLLRSILLDPSRTTNGGSNARKYLLTGRTVCSACGGRMVARPRDDGARRYVCVDNVEGHQSAILAEPLEDMVRDTLLEALTMFPARFELANSVPTEDEDGRSLVAEQQKYETLLERLKQEYAEEGIWTKDDFLRRRAGLEAKLDDVRRELAQRVEQRVLADVPHGNVEKWWADASFDQRRDLVLALVDRIEVGPAVRGLNRFDPRRVAIFAADWLASEDTDTHDFFAHVGRAAEPVLR